MRLELARYVKKLNFILSEFFLRRNSADESAMKEEKSSPTAKILGFLASVVLRFLSRTLTWKIEGMSTEQEHWSAGTPVILTFWHGEQLLMPWSYLRGSKRDRKPIRALISLHGDGRIAAECMKLLGIGTIGGSSTRGGARALVALQRALRAGMHVAMTPDGPKGPHQEVKEGVIKLASLSQAPILPVSIRASSVWTFGSWDKMFLPKPFSRVALVFGEPFFVSKDIGREELGVEARRLEGVLSEIQNRACALV